jgi:nitroreductase
MDDEAALRDKLRKIEALFAGAATAGEKAAAGAAAERIRTRLREEEKREKPVEMRFSLPDPWARHLFIALCRRYGLRPYRYPHMRQQSLNGRTIGVTEVLDAWLAPDHRYFKAHHV